MYNKKREKHRHTDMKTEPRMSDEKSAENFSDDSGDRKTGDEREQALLALIKYRTEEVERNQWRVNHYTAEVLSCLDSFLL